VTGPVVVTGAGQGLGAAVAQAFASGGAPVLLADIDGDRAEAVAAQLRAAGRQAAALAADVASEPDIDALAARCLELYGPAGVWVNNAGVSKPAMLIKMTLADFRAVTDVHVTGTFLGLRAAARQMIEHQVAGSVINVTSSDGLQGTIGQVNYSAAKGAITAMTKSGARELARYGIRVNAVAPVAATPMTSVLRSDEKLKARYLAQIPLGRFAEPDEVVSAFTYLASDAAAYVTGQVLCIDGGLYMAS
jgi:3-oxoacyl-[acyl-carrier protein] reductase